MLEPLARFLHRAGGLKRVPRTGWLDRGVPPGETESVADHVWRTALLAWLAAVSDPTLDRDRVLKLALIHDLAEATTGDEPPYDRATLTAETDPQRRAALLNRRHQPDPVRRSAKQTAENASFAQMIDSLSEPLADELAGLWREMHERTTAEARFVKDADRLETYLQSREYLADDPRRPMASFAAEVDEATEASVMQALRDEITKLDIASSSPTT